MRFERSWGGVVVSLGKEGSGDGEPVVDFPVLALGGGVDPTSVLVSAVLPEKTSWALTNPSAVSTSPTQTCLQSERLSRE